MLQLRQNQSLQQRLTPQQVQYLKLLQLPIIALEQRIKSEIEENPMLEESMEDEEEVQSSSTEPTDAMEASAVEVAADGTLRDEGQSIESKQKEDEQNQADAD